MHLDCSESKVQISLRWGAGYSGLVTSLLHNSTVQAKTRSFQPQLTQMTSPEAIYEISCSICFFPLKERSTDFVCKLWCRSSLRDQQIIWSYPLGTMDITDFMVFPPITNCQLRAGTGAKKCQSLYRISQESISWLFQLLAWIITLYLFSSDTCCMIK